MSGLPTQGTQLRTIENLFYKANNLDLSEFSLIIPADRILLPAGRN